MSIFRRVGKYAATAAAMSGAGRWLANKRGKAAIDDPVPGTAQWPALPDPFAPDEASTPAQPEPAPPEPAEPEPWVKPDDQGACPTSHPIKAKKGSGIYHVPDGQMYERTSADRCYLNPDAAEGDGYRLSKR